MAGPFYNAIKSIALSAPGTGAFTPGSSVADYSDWSTIPAGWMGPVRFQDGSNWEISYCYWSGTTLSRASTQVMSSSTGGLLSLSATSTAALMIGAGEVEPHLIIPMRGVSAVVGTSTWSIVGFGSTQVLVSGTAAAVSLTSTSLLAEQIRVQMTSATTASAKAGISLGSSFTTAVASSLPGRGGWEVTCRFGFSALPTGPRIFIGMTGASDWGGTTEPSATVSNTACLGKDSTDTNLQLIVNNNSGSGTKTDTGIPLVAGGWYEVSLWTNPGSLTVYMLLLRLDTGAIWYGSTSVDVPVSGALHHPHALGALNSTNTGVAMVMHIQSLWQRNTG